ncbi:hypothetical protein HG531_010782 [Fusarium graminearum]|nr:hypothetical protein HG531_010782 [Fusarium graminearum]
MLIISSTKDEAATANLGCPRQQHFHDPMDDAYEQWYVSSEVCIAQSGIYSRKGDTVWPRFVDCVFESVKSQQLDEFAGVIAIRHVSLIGIVESGEDIVSIALSECSGFVALTRYQDHPGADVISEP